MAYTDKELRRTLAAYQAACAAGCEPRDAHIGPGKRSAQQEAGTMLGVCASTVRRHLDALLRQGIELLPPKPVEVAPKPRVRVPAQVSRTGPQLADAVIEFLKTKTASIEQIAVSIGAVPSDVGTQIERLRGNGVRLKDLGGGIWGLDRSPPPAAWLSGPHHSFFTAEDNTFTFGACGDQHLGSKYARHEVNAALYDAYEQAGVKVVFNTGNWIDGEARFNVHDLEVHGMDAQLRHLAAAYPRRDGITTYAVAGDDHEGWYAQREGVDIGRYAERVMRDAGRTDWVDLGYMEAPVSLVSHLTGKEAIITVAHPGGGSSYALSYSIQKIIESLDGGEKPGIGLYGHYHKLWTGNIRNVWCVQTGTGQDQTPFMRKKKLEAHVGGYLCKATMDPATGAITRFQTECFRFFNRGYSANRWSHSGPVTMLGRTP